MAHPVPGESCYSFDCVNGHLCHSSGAFWYPLNPDYDPGPPPPPPEEKKPPAKSTSETDTDTSQLESIEEGQSVFLDQDVTSTAGS